MSRSQTPGEKVFVAVFGSLTALILIYWAVITIVDPPADGDFGGYRSSFASANCGEWESWNATKQQTAATDLFAHQASLHGDSVTTSPYPDFAERIGEVCAGSSGTSLAMASLAAYG